MAAVGTARPRGCQRAGPHRYRNGPPPERFRVTGGAQALEDSQLAHRHAPSPPLRMPELRGTPSASRLSSGERAQYGLVTVRAEGRRAGRGLSCRDVSPSPDYPGAAEALPGGKGCGGAAVPWDYPGSGKVKPRCELREQPGEEQPLRSANKAFPRVILMSGILKKSGSPKEDG